MVEEPILPSEVSDQQGRFDRFAAWLSALVGGTRFFGFALAFVLGAALSGFLFGFSTRWHAWFHSTIAAITLLLVAVLENAQRRSDQAVQHKLNGIAVALEDHMDRSGAGSPSARAELRHAVDLESREATTANHRHHPRHRGRRAPPKRTTSRTTSRTVPRAPVRDAARLQRKGR